jgi:hypothetical protein
MLSCRNLGSKNVQIGSAIALIHEALGALRSCGRGIGSRRSSGDRRLNLSILVPFVEGGDVDHLQLAVVGVRQGQVRGVRRTCANNPLQEIRKHGAFGGSRAGSAGQRDLRSRYR